MIIDVCIVSSYSSNLQFDNRFEGLGCLSFSLSRYLYIRALCSTFTMQLVIPGILLSTQNSPNSPTFKQVPYDISQFDSIATAGAFLAVGRGDDDAGAGLRFTFLSVVSL